MRIASLFSFLLMFGFAFFFGENKKVRQPKSAHRKTQTPIVAKQTQEKDKYTLYPNLTEFTFLPSSYQLGYDKKSIAIHCG
ncbi:MAG: hypothetical protein IKC31_02620 [Clostridia bacterium]|nr:hypothetical protein [Clostridia bacterium]